MVSLLAFAPASAAMVSSVCAPDDALSLLFADNFASWKRSLKIALSAKNKLCIVDGSYPVRSENSMLYNQWMRVNDMIISWVMK